VLADDGYGLGVLFMDRQAPAPASSSATASLVEIEAEFAVCRR
jgi:hypothetical protein